MEELKKKIAEFTEKHPEALTIITGLKAELENAVHPPVNTEDDEDIEAKLDASYKRILRDNKRSSAFRALEVLLTNLLAHAAAKHGIVLK